MVDVKVYVEPTDVRHLKSLNPVINSNRKLIIVLFKDR
jgi:hypothetical protein